MANQRSLQLPPPQTSAPVLGELTAEAEERGRVPVIVVLRVDAKPEGLIPGTARARQRTAIRSAQTRVLAGLARTRATRIKRFTVAPILAAHVTPAGLRALGRSRLVGAIERDQAVELPDPRRRPSRARAAQVLEGWWDVYRTGMDTAWKQGYDGRGQVVAILDTGTESGHSWLAGKVIGEGCFSTTGCPNGATSQFGAGAAAPCTYASGCAHGTHVAHTAAGKYGVANGAQIVAIQVFSKFVAPNCRTNEAICTKSYTSDQLRALEYVYSLRVNSGLPIAAANLSLGGGRYPGYCDAGGYSFQYLAATLRSWNVATVVSSGNDGYSNGIGSPACNSASVSVGASTLASGRDAVATFSNSASILWLLAPGEDICSALPGNRYDCTWDGTSMAAPHVTGAFAVLRQLRPQTTVAASLEALRRSGTGVRDPRNGVVRSRIHVWNALVALNSS